MSKPVGWNSKPAVKVPKSELGSSKGRVQLKPEKIQDLINQQGVRVKVYRSMLCPNVKSIDGGEHEIDCPICHGNGFADLRPICTVAFIQTQDLTKVHNAEGYWDGNTVAATFLPGIELQYFTLVELPDFTDIFYERIKRQQGPIDNLKYKALCVNVVLDSDGKEYFAGNDFDIDVNGSIRWKVDRGPLPGTIYSIHYEMTVQFRAIKAMHVNRFLQVSARSTDVEMTKQPEQWMLQKEFFVKRKDAQGNELNANLIRDPDEDTEE